MVIFQREIVNVYLHVESEMEIELGEMNKCYLIPFSSQGDFKHFHIGAMLNNNNCG